MPWVRHRENMESPNVESFVLYFTSIAYKNNPISKKPYLVKCLGRLKDLILMPYWLTAVQGGRRFTSERYVNGDNAYHIFPGTCTYTLVCPSLCLPSACEFCGRCGTSGKHAVPFGSGGGTWSMKLCCNISGSPCFNFGFWFGFWLHLFTAKGGRTVLHRSKTFQWIRIL